MSRYDAVLNKKGVEWFKGEEEKAALIALKKKQKEEEKAAHIALMKKRADKKAEEFKESHKDLKLESQCVLSQI